jgi:hypothetical protein
MRLAERVVNAPARTGDFGQVKPRTYTAFVEFCIALFNALRDRGWRHLRQDWPRRSRRTRWMVESFPSMAWRTLGLERLPGKARMRGKPLTAYRRGLMDVTGYSLPRGLNHDQLQAAVVLPAGEAVLTGRRQGLLMAGIDPIPYAGHLTEGWIVLPAPLESFNSNNGE